MSREPGQFLAINLGSSSVKFALYSIDADSAPVRIYVGKLDGIGSLQGGLAISMDDGEKIIRPVSVPDHAAAAALLMDWLHKGFNHDRLVAIGHRIVYGGSRFREAQKISQEMLAALTSLADLDPEHLPGELFLAERFMQEFPQLPHIACFDTDFHQHLPRVAQLFPIPRRYFEQGIRRFGFHGLSCEYLLDTLALIAGNSAARGRVIIAHLGNGASVTAVLDGKSIDTSMGLTPASGIPMSSRSGDLDPGLIAHLAVSDQMTVQQFQHMVNHESGLLGVSEISSDINELLLRETQDARAADAINLFCYHAKKTICALTGSLEGMDTLIFSGGIGENSSEIRARICAGLGFLGIELDAVQNAANAAVISTAASRVAVRVIATDEESIMAQHCARVLGLRAQH